MSLVTCSSKNFVSLCVQNMVSIRVLVRESHIGCCSKSRRLTLGSSGSRGSKVCFSVSKEMQ